MRESARHLAKILVFIPAFAFAEGGKPLPITVEDSIHKAAVAAFFSECVDAKGYLRSTPDKQWCKSEKEQLDRTQERLDALAADVEKKAAAQCDAEPDAKLDAEMEKVIAATLDKHLTTCEKNSETDVNSCMRQLSCQNLMSIKRRSFRSPIDFAIGQSIERLNLGKECRNLPGQNLDCGDAAALGIVKSIWVTTKGLFYDLPRFVFGIKDEAALKEFEKVNSNSLAQASGLSNADVEKSSRNPGAFLVDVMSAIYSSIESASRKTFGCGRWSGVPYQSECLETMKSWDCATCAQRSQVICGVGGFMAGEIANSYAIGGLFYGGMQAAKATSKVAVAGSEQIVKLADEIPAFGQVFSQSRELALALYGSTSGIRRVAAASIRTTGTALNSVKTALPQSTEFSKTLSGVVFYPVSRYFRLMDDAMKLGFQHGEKAFVTVGGAGKANFYVGLPKYRSTDTEIKLDAESAKYFKEYGSGTIKTSDPRVNLRYDRTTNVLVINRTSN